MGEMCLYERATFQQGQQPPAWFCSGKGNRGPEAHDLFAMTFCLQLYVDNICFPSIEAAQCVPFLYLLPIGPGWPRDTNARVCVVFGGKHA